MTGPALFRTRWERSVLGRCAGLPRVSASTLLSSTADQFGLIALIWLVLTTTGSPAAVGAVVLCNRAPAVLSAPMCGATGKKPMR